MLPIATPSFRSHRLHKGAASIVACSLCLSCGLPAAHAWEPGIDGSRADVIRSGKTIDGWTVTAKKQGEKFRIVAPLAGDAASHEGFISLQGIGEITGKGTSKVLQGTVDVGYMVGCGVDISDGFTIGQSHSASLTPSVGVSTDKGVSSQTTGHGSVTPNGSVTGNGSLTPTVTLGFPMSNAGGSATVGASATGGASATVGASETLGGHANSGTHADLTTTLAHTSSFSAHVKPGYITTVWLLNAKLRSMRGGVSITGANLAVTGCGTTVKIRSVVRFLVETEQGTAMVIAYGRPFRI